MKCGCTMIIGLLTGTSVAMARDRYVSTTGSNSNPGTIGQPHLTINAAITESTAGDTIYVRGGVYASERISFSAKNGTADAPITLISYPGETAIIDRSADAPPIGDAGLVEIVDSSYITVQGLEIRNFKTTDTARAPIGIFVHGSGTGVRLIGNKVHDIWQSNATATAGNAFGIAIKGTAATAIDGIVIDGNELYALRTGFSESMTINGNVTNFTVTNNLVHDCNNIGIDFIGYEGTNSNVALDRARGGICRGNTVYNIDTQYNPAYGGNFAGTFASQTARNDSRAGPGIYVDGGADITIERNHVHDCNMGVSIGSEHSGKVSDNVRCKNNLIRDNHIGGIFLGGAGTSNGGTTNTTINNNTLYLNDREVYGGGSISIQRLVSTTTIKNNLIFAKTDGSGFAQFILKTNTTGSFAANSINWNLYSSTTPLNSYEFWWNNVAKTSFASWRTASGQDANSIFTTASLGFANAAANDFSLLSTSIARDAGDPSFMAASGERDFGGQNRVANSRVDIDMDEYMTTWQSWRDQYFNAPDGGAGASATDDFDNDGLKNLIEYSQGTNPALNEAAQYPRSSRAGNGLRYTYRKSAAELTYAVQTSTNLTSWSTTAVAEQTDGAGLFWRDFPFTTQPLFVRLQVVQP